MARIGNNIKTKEVWKNPHLSNATLAKAADERLNQLNFQMASLRFGMAKEIAAHAPFRKEFISTQESRDRPYNTT